MQVDLTDPVLLSPKQAIASGGDKVRVSLDETLREQMIKVFEEDPIAFGKFFLPDLFTCESATFHYEIASLFSSSLLRVQQKKDREVIKSSLIVPRSHAKSSVAVKLYYLWAIMYNKFNYGIILTCTLDLATEHLDFIRGELESNTLLKQFYLKDPNDSFDSGNKWNSEIIDISHPDRTDPMRIKAYGAGKKMRGTTYKSYRPDSIIVDDLEDDEQVESKERRSKLKRWFLGSVEPCFGPFGGYLCIIGTILHFDSILNNIKENTNDNYKDFQTIEYKAIITDQDTQEETALWEDGFSLEALYAKRQELIGKGEESTFSREYMNEPIADGQRMFSERLVNESIIEPEELPPRSEMFVSMGIDLATTKDERNDKNAITVVGITPDNHRYVLYSWGDHVRTPEMIDRILSIYLMYKPDVVGGEKIGLTHAILPFLWERQREMGCHFTIELVDVSTRSKDQRVKKLEPYFSNGTMHLLLEHSDLKDELMQFPLGRFDDITDSFEVACKLLPATFTPVSSLNFTPRTEYYHKHF